MASCVSLPLLLGRDTTIEALIGVGWESHKSAVFSNRHREIGVSTGNIRRPDIEGIRVRWYEGLRSTTQANMQQRLYWFRPLDR